jgi:hypothetical protein
MYLPPARDSFERSELSTDGYATTFNSIFSLLLFFEILQSLIGYILLRLTFPSAVCGVSFMYIQHRVTGRYHDISREDFRMAIKKADMKLVKSPSLCLE